MSDDPQDERERERTAMTGSNNNWRKPPPFEQVLYGFPSEVVNVSDAEERPRSLGTRRRKAVVAGLVAVLVTGGVTGAYAVHERNVQKTAWSKPALEVSREDVRQAAELDAARVELEENLEHAREVYDVSEHILADDDAGLRVARDDAVTQAADLLQNDIGATDLEDVTGVTDALRTAKAAVESAMVEHAREVLSEALDAAGAVLAQSAGVVADEQVRIELSEAVEHARTALDSDDATPVAMVDSAQELTQLTQSVTAAVESYERERLERQQQQQQQPVLPPASSGSGSSGGSSSRDDDAGTRTSNDSRPGRGTPSPNPDAGDSTEAPPTEPAEDTTEDPTSEPTDPAPPPGDDSEVDLEPHPLSPQDE